MKSAFPCVPQATREPKEPVDNKDLYLDLMKKSLAGLLYDELGREIAPRNLLARAATRLFSKFGLRLFQRQPRDPQAREEGRDWPSQAHTMIGLKRLDNLQTCIEETLTRNISGDLIETGVWRGGASIFMRAVLKAHNIAGRTVWVADSFQGLPPPQADKYPLDKRDNHHLFHKLAVSLDEVKANFDRYGLLDEQVRFLPGWFRDTLPTTSGQTWSVIRLDGDMYESTMDGLTHLYPNLSRGGYLIVDDYGAVDACRQAVDDFRRSQGITEEIKTIDWTGVFWRRET